MACSIIVTILILAFVGGINGLDTTAIALPIVETSGSVDSAGLAASETVDTALGNQLYPTLILYTPLGNSLNVGDVTFIIGVFCNSL